MYTPIEYAPLPVIQVNELPKGDDYAKQLLNSTSVTLQRRGLNLLTEQHYIVKEDVTNLSQV